jgi:hypothetical protein
MEPAVKETGPVAAKPGPPSDDQSSAAAAAAAAAAADFLMEEQKYDDSKTDIETALREIQAMLKIELEHWFRTDNSATSELIGRYDTAIELLITFVRERDVNAFCLVFTKFNITIQGIRGCFYNSGPNVKARRNRAHRLFGRVCTIMVGPACVFYFMGLLFSSAFSCYRHLATSRHTRAGQNNENWRARGAAVFQRPARRGGKGRRGRSALHVQVACVV